MVRQSLCISFISLLLTACATATSSDSYDPATQARIRVYGANGINAIFFPGESCIPQWASPKWMRVGVRASGSISQSLGSFLSTKSNSSLGIAPTERMQSPQSGMIAKEFYSEYVVPANQSIAVLMFFQDIQDSDLPFNQAVERAKNPPLNNGADRVATALELLTQQPDWLRTQALCKSRLRDSFKPEPGQDYEISFDFKQSPCLFSISHIQPQQDEETAAVEPVFTWSASLCRHNE